MKSISTFVIAFLIVGFFFLALPDKGYAGAGMTSGCCQVIVDGQSIGCADSTMTQCQNENQFFPAENCNLDAGLCPSFVPPIVSANVPIPTLSEWGLIALAVVLGIVGYLVIRRKKVAV